jgi:hypothetical protein
MGRGMAEAVGRSANTIAGYMSQAAGDSIDRQHRQEDKLEQLRVAGELRKEQIEATAAGKDKSLTDDEIDEQAAGNLGTTLPEVRKLRKAVQTGDLSEYPPGFETQFEAKAKALYAIRESIARGKDYQPITAGRETQQKVDQVGGIVAGAMDPVKVGTAQAAVKGEGPYKITDNLIGNQFTGDATVTPVGSAQIKKDERPPQSTIDAPVKATIAALKERRQSAEAEANRIQKSEAAALKAAGANRKRQDAVKTEFAEQKAEIQKRLEAIDRDLQASQSGGPGAKPAPAPASASKREFKILR